MLLAGRRRATHRRQAPAAPNVVALSLPGNADNPISTSSPTGFPASTIDIRFKGTVEESNPTTRVLVHKADELLRLSVTWNHLLRLQWRNPAGFQQINATAAHGVTLGAVAGIRAVLRSNGGTGSIIEFFKSADWDPATDIGTWTQIGASVNSTQSATFHSAGGGALHIGGRADNEAENLDSDLTFVSLRSYGGAEFVRFDPTTVTATDVRAPADYTDPMGNVWTLSGSTWSWVTEDGGGPQEPEPVATVSDTFDSEFDWVKWPNSYGDFTITGGRLRVTCSSAYPAVSSANVHDLSVEPATVEMPTVPTAGTGTTQTQFMLATGAGSSGGFEVTGSPPALRMIGTGLAGTSVTYDAVAHRWLRLRLVGTDLLFDASPDKTVWTNLRIVAAPAWVTSDPLRLFLTSGFYGTETTPGFAEFDNVNV